MQPRASQVVRTGLRIAGVLAGLFSLFCALMVGMGVGTGPPIDGHAHFASLINQECDWLLACALLFPVTLAFPNRRPVVARGVGYAVLGVGVGSCVYWMFAPLHLDAPEHYGRGVLMPAEFVSACLAVAGALRLYLTRKQ